MKYHSNFCPKHALFMSFQSFPLLLLFFIMKVYAIRSIPRVKYLLKPLLLTIGTVLENVMLGNQGDPERQIIHDSFLSYSTAYCKLALRSLCGQGGK